MAHPLSHCPQAELKLENPEGQFWTHWFDDKYPVLQIQTPLIELAPEGHEEIHVEPTRLKPVTQEVQLDMFWPHYLHG